MLLVLSDENHGLRVQEATFADHLASWVRPGRLDSELAAGESPESRSALATRATVLVRPHHRRLLAKSLTRVLSDAARPGRSIRGSRVSVARRNVLGAAGQLRELIERLLQPAPLPSRGLAALELLLTDGAGPIYNPNSNEDLRAAVGAVLDALEPLNDYS
jgi:hypothetical protein